jgi:16S rRNA (guanine966-N2)-methyltransferase
MRIIAGRHRGRRLAVPDGLDVRPTSDRAREALMSILEHGEPPLVGARFLDLFAGSGAVGLEARSRGAAEVLLVEQAREAQAAIRANIAALGEGEAVTLRAGHVARLGPAHEPFDIVFLDPPYGSGLAGPALTGLIAGGWVASGARIVVELAAGEPFVLCAGLELESERRYGRGRFVFLRCEPTERRNA